MDAAAAFLGVRPRSVAETTRRLKHLGYPEGLVEQVVTQLIELNYLDDETFARAWVESRDRARPRGQLALRRELAQKGVDRQLVDQVLAERQESATGAQSELLAARRLLERRRRTLDSETDPYKRRQKGYALLARNGFDPDVCHQATIEFLGQGP
jgi:regulatory protein